MLSQNTHGKGKVETKWVYIRYKGLILCLESKFTNVGHSWWPPFCMEMLVFKETTI